MDKQYKIFIDNREYTSWTLYNPLTFEELYKKGDEDAPQVPEKYFNKDIFSITPEGRPIITYSQVRESEYIAGILILEGNRTYGRTKNGKKMLYKCVPDDKRLPIFLIPYEQKIGFSKKSNNKYILFRFATWDDKHPHGVMTNSLGDVNSLESFYIYQLYRKSLQIPITEFSQKIKKCLSENCGEAAKIESAIRNHPDFLIEDRVNCAGSPRIITIDNPNTIDYDDAISIQKNENGYIVSIYITNVVYVLETLDLWSSLTKRVATIYLPDGRRPMLPSLLTDNLCSLQAGKRRFCFVCDIEVLWDGGSGKIRNSTFSAAEICVEKNYSYFSPNWRKTPHINNYLKSHRFSGIT